VSSFEPYVHYTAILCAHTHRLICLYDNTPVEHAEVRTLRHFSRVCTRKQARRGVILFNFALTRSRTVRRAEPCRHCAIAIARAHAQVPFRRLFWTTSDRVIVRASLNDVSKIVG